MAETERDGPHPRGRPHTTPQPANHDGNSRINGGSDNLVEALSGDELVRHAHRVNAAGRRQWWQNPPRGTGRSEQIRRILTAAKAECVTRRDRVFKHPDLVAALRQPPLSMRPECWNGYVPPAFDPPPVLSIWWKDGRWETEVGPAARNTSPYRAALIEICSAAYEREKAAGDA